jgi:uncharacterized protein (DUF2062 family)
MQADSIHREQRKYSGYIDAVRKLWTQGGPRAFFRGFTPCMVIPTHYATPFAPSSFIITYLLDMVLVGDMPIA